MTRRWWSLSEHSRASRLSPSARVARGSIRLVPNTAVTIGGIDVELMPERALFVPSARALVVADIMMSTRESQRRVGVATTHELDEETLVRLGRAAMRAGAKVIVVIGELTSAVTEPDDAQMALFEAFRERCALPIRLCEGPRDRGVRTLPSAWCIDRVGEKFALGGFCFRHQPIVSTLPQWSLCGCLNPSCADPSFANGRSLPAFVIDHELKSVALPAFSKSARDSAVTPRAGVEIYAIHDAVVSGPVSSTPTHNPTVGPACE